MRKMVISLAVISVLILAGSASTVTAAPHVENISLKKQGEFVELTVYADGPFTFTHFIEEAKAGKPYRVVLDMKECLHNLPQFNFRDLPTDVISSIRTSQYKIKPDKVVRIVADISRPVTYLVKQAEGSVTLVFAAPQEKEFSFWCAAPISDAEKIELALKETKSETVSAPHVVAAHPEMEEKAKQDGTFKPPAFPLKSETKDQTVVEKPAEVKPAPVEKNVVSKKTDAFSADERQAIKQKLANRSDDEKWVDPVVADAVKSDEPVKEKKAVIPEAKTEVKKQIVLPAPNNKSALTDSQPTAPAESKMMDKAASPVTEPIEEKDDPAQQKLWKSEKELRKNPESPPKSKGSLASAFPKREVVRYRSFGRRDPFMPLVSKSLSGYHNGDIPDVETLRLVGVLQGEYNDMALLEDMEGYGYILQDGDKVKNGHVIQIYKDKVLFQISEFGWSRSVALTMDLDED